MEHRAGAEEGDPAILSAAQKAYQQLFNALEKEGREAILVAMQEVWKNFAAAAGKKK